MPFIRRVAARQEKAGASKKEVSLVMIEEEEKEAGGEIREMAVMRRAETLYSLQHFLPLSVSVIMRMRLFAVINNNSVVEGETNQKKKKREKVHLGIGIFVVTESACRHRILALRFPTQLLKKKDIIIVIILDRRQTL